MNQDDVLQEPGFSQEPPPAEDVVEAIPEKPIIKFDERYKQALVGLLYIGAQTHHFQWFGHSFVMKSPRLCDVIQIGLLHKPYVGTGADIKAWQALHAAACIVSIDGQPLPIPISEDVDWIESRFNYIVQNWYPWTLDAVYEQYLLLDREINRVCEEATRAAGLANEN